MKLYRVTGSGHFLPTQDLAKHAARNGGRAFDKCEVPTSEGREALCDFLNDIVDEAAGLAVVADRAAREDEERPEPAPAIPPATPCRQASDIQDFILNGATVAECENIFASLGTRFAELAKEQRA